jgi:hypothetical protein
LFIELAAVELLSDKPNLDQKVLILADEFVKMGKIVVDTTLENSLSLNCRMEFNGAEITKTPIKAKALAYYNFENLKELVSFNNKNQ